MIDVGKYIRIPFLDRGRDFDGCDCIGLVLLVFRTEYGIELPDPAYHLDLSSEEIARLIDVNQPLFNAVKIEPPKEGDIVLVWKNGYPSHVGIYLEDGRMLHVTERLGTLCEKIGSPTLKEHMVEGFYRIRS